MMKRIVLPLLVSAFIGIAACVGDDPAGATTSDDAGGGDGTVQSDAGDTPDTATSGDGSADADAGADAGFPASLPGLVLWLEGDFVPGTAGASVTSWPDQSSHHNNATTTGTAPKLVYHDAQFNGHSAVTFSNDNTYLTIPDDQSLHVDGTGFLVEIVESHPPITASGSEKGDAVYSKLSAGNGIGLHAWLVNVGIGAGPGFGPDNEITVYSSAGANTVNRERVRFKPLAGNDAGIFSAQANQSSEGTYQIDGTPDLGGGSTAATIGKFLNNGDSFSLAALIIVKGPISDDDVNNLETYLKTRYGL